MSGGASDASEPRRRARNEPVARERHGLKVSATASPPRTPDGRYLVVRETLWRASNPTLDVDVRERLVRELMDGRRAVARARREGDVDAEGRAHADVDRVKRALGERGDVWWTDGTPDFNRRRIAKTPYAAWWATRAPD